MKEIPDGFFNLKRKAFLRVLCAFSVSLVVLGFWVLTLVTNGFTGGVAFFLIVVLVFFGVTGWGFYYYANTIYPSYVVYGIRIYFGDMNYYEDPNTMRDFLMEHLIEPFKDEVSIRGYDIYEILDGVKVFMEPNQPVFLDRLVIGISWVWHRYSVVYAPYILNSGAMAYELKLQICEALFPGRGEGDNINWMKSKGIL